MINVNHVTMTYPNKKGIFDVDFKVKAGEAVGYLGPNGAGKSTTIRALMGFMPVDKGQITIDGMDCFTKAPCIMKNLGYIPGEIAFPDGMTGEGYLKMVAELRKLKDTSRRDELLERFELNPKGKIRRYSKGMKQKLGIVAAFMHSPGVLILDEPTSGLDPLMQSRFIELLEEEKKKGTTILISSHMFEEIERVCDRVLIIKEGHLVAKDSMENLKSSRRKCYVVHIPEAPVIAKQFEPEFSLGKITEDRFEVYITGNRMDSFIKKLAQFPVTDLEVKNQTLEDVFMSYYRKEGEE